MSEMEPTVNFESPAEEFFKGFTPERVDEIKPIWGNITKRFEAFSLENSNINIGNFVKTICFEPADPKTEEKYQMPLLASYRLGANGPEIVIHERFFQKNENEQIYILTHELSHILINHVFSKEAVDQLSALCQETPLEEETKYVNKVAQAQKNGRLTQEQLLAEKLAEHLASYQLGEGKISKIAAIRALYSNNPNAFREGIPDELLDDDQKVEEFLLGNAPNEAIGRLKKIQAIFKQELALISQEAQEKQVDLVDFQGLSEYHDFDHLGSSENLNNFVAQNQSRPTGKRMGFWGFIKWLFTGNQG